MEEIGPTAWNRLSGGRPFQSYAWYVWGEKILSDCPPTYILLSRDDREIARAAFWLTRNEPLSVFPPMARALLGRLLQHRPLMICRSPLACTSGVILPESQLRRDALKTIADTALEIARNQHASLVLFDFETAQASQIEWPNGFRCISLNDPGTRLEIRWANFEEYLASLSKNQRKHYKRSVRNANDLGIRVARHSAVSDIPTALELVGKIDRRYGNSPDPWIRRVMEHLHLSGGTWLTAHLGDRLVGSELVLRDGNSHLHTGLGIQDDLPYVYFVLGYEGIRLAIEQGVQTLRWGSGAFEVKQRLGFQPETNDHFVFSGTGILTRWLCRLAAQFGSP
ncbi:MAG: GNAT family N-acetyltransferase [Anaerolineales bacterium]|nr:GNAT family N-acetyltransferase [Anaerolineales bacterium]